MARGKKQAAPTAASTKAQMAEAAKVEVKEGERPSEAVKRTAAERKAQAETQAPASKAGSGKESVPSGHKRCPRCGRVLPVEAFAKNKASKDGLYSICKECEKADRERLKVKKAETAVAEAKADNTKLTPPARASRKQAAATAADGYDPLAGVQTTGAQVVSVAGAK